MMLRRLITGGESVWLREGFWSVVSALFKSGLEMIMVFLAAIGILMKTFTGIMGL